MSAWIIAQTEWKRLLRNRIARLALLVGVFIPLLYSGLYLYAFWDPYGSLDQLPVALVNLDQGGVNDGKQEHFGEQLVDELVQDRKLDWQVVDKSTANKGLEGDQYYMVVTIPPTFTEDSLSVTGDHPHQANIIFTPNEGKNYVVAQISKRIEAEIREKAGNKYTETYVKNILDVVGNSRDGISNASTAAGDIAKGANSLNDGSSQIQTAIGKASTGAKSLDNGATKLETGTHTLADGMSQLAAGTFQLQNGLNQVNQGIGNVQSKVGSTEESKTTSTSGPNTLQSGIAQVQSGLQQTASANQTAFDLLAAYSKRNPSTSTDPDFQKALGTLDSINKQSPSLLNGTTGLSNGLADLYKGLDRLKSGVEQSQSGAGQIAANSQKLVDGSNEINKGAGQLQQGAHSLSNGLGEISLHTGDLTAGAGKLQDGSQELSNKLAESVKSTQAPAEQLASVISDPVQTQEERLHPIDQYGAGLAAYFLPLSLWVGGLMLYFILPLREDRWKIGPHSPASVVFGKFLTLAPIGVLQAIISGLVIHYGIGLPIAVGPAFYLFMILIAWMSIAFIGFLIGTFGSGPGRLLAVMFLILQLVSSGGTFPTELIPAVFQKVHPFLPMSYGVTGLHNILSLGDMSEIWKSSGMIALFFAVPLLIWALLQKRLFTTKNMREKDILEAV